MLLNECYGRNGCELTLTVVCGAATLGAKWHSNHIQLPGQRPTVPSCQCIRLIAVAVSWNQRDRWHSIGRSAVELSGVGDGGGAGIATSTENQRRAVADDDGVA